MFIFIYSQLEEFYNFFLGCDPCNKKGHICDPNNGKCVCPYLTLGEECEECIANSWGYNPHEGCKVSRVVESCRENASNSS